MVTNEAVTAALHLDVERVMQGKPEALGGSKVIPQLQSSTLGAVPGTPVADRVRIALGRATDTLRPTYRRQAARVLLGLDETHPRSFTKRVDEFVQIYQDVAAGAGPDRPSRQHRQVLLRAEVPELRASIVDALVDLERDFLRAQRSEGRRHVLDRTVKVMTWQGYDERARLLAEKLRPLRPDVDPEDPASEDWAVIGVSRGGLPLAVHLSHLLGCRVFGSVSLWKYRKGQKNAAVIDGLYTPPRDANGSPGTLLVVDDVVASGQGLALVSRLLKDHYGNPPVRILEASLLRDVRKAPLSHDSVTAEEYDSTKYWWSLPWEEPAPSRVGPVPSTAAVRRRVAGGGLRSERDTEP